MPDHKKRVLTKDQHAMCTRIVPDLDLEPAEGKQLNNYFQDNTIGIAMKHY